MSKSIAADSALFVNLNLMDELMNYRILCLATESFARIVH
jgi:hypothetical protein